MGADVSATELVRRRFHNGVAVQPLRRDTRAALGAVIGGTADPDWLIDVLNVVSELVQNVNQHTGGDGELVVSRAPGMVVIEVGDASTALPAARRADPNRPGGRGLSLIEALAHRWGVRTCHRGKAVWVQVAIR